MQDQQTAILTTVLSDVLANLAFMFTGEGELDPPVGERWLETVISYEGTVAGTLQLTCTATFASRLAANLLGMESEKEASELEARDAVQEFMNIVCGQYVTAVYGIEDIFSLTIPEVVELYTSPSIGDSGDVSEDLAILSVDGQLMQLCHTRSDLTKSF